MVKQLVLFCSKGSLSIFNGIDARIKRSWLGRAIRRIQESRRVPEMENCGQETEDDRCEQMRMEQRKHSLAMKLKDVDQGRRDREDRESNERGWYCCCA